MVGSEEVRDGHTAGGPAAGRQTRKKVVETPHPPAKKQLEPPWPRVGAIVTAGL